MNSQKTIKKIMMEMIKIIIYILKILGMLALIFLLMVIYFVPTIIAIWCNKKHLGLIILLNIFLGWTIFFWFVALIISIVVSKKE